MVEILFFGAEPLLSEIPSSRRFFLGAGGRCFRAGEFEFVFFHIHATPAKGYSFGFEAQTLFDG